MTLGDSAGTQSNYCLNTPLPLLVVQANTKEIKDVIFFQLIMNYSHSVLVHVDQAKRKIHQHI